MRAADGQLWGPVGLRFTADGARIVIADMLSCARRAGSRDNDRQELQAHL